MKGFTKIGVIFAAFIIMLVGTVAVLNRPVVQEAQATFNQPSYPDPKEIICVEGKPNIENNQKFSLKVDQINVSYRWHIQSQTATTVTYRLQVDVNPTNAETWLNVQGNITRIVEIPNCEPQPCEQLDQYEIAQDEVIIPCITPTVTPTITPTATPSATPTPTPGEPAKIQGSTTEAPVCRDGKTVNVPANPHVWRAGDKATVNFFVTEGDRADVVYKEVNASDWQHAITDLKANGDGFVSVEIGGLDANLGYTFGVRQRVGCGGGETITAVIVDGPEPTLFQFSYWEVK